MKKILILFIAVNLLSCVVVVGNTRQPATCAVLEKAVRRQPGNMDLRCQLIEAYLADGDTVAAIKELDYSLALGDVPCLLVHKANLLQATGQLSLAARYCAKAVVAGCLPNEQPLIHYIDSLSNGAVRVSLKTVVKTDKSNTASLLGLAQLSIMDGDSSSALLYIEESLVRGDSTMAPVLHGLRHETIGTDSDYEVVASFPFTRSRGKMEINGTVNGLAVKIELDTAATISTVSEVETLFMLKNNYIGTDDIVDNRIVVSREIGMGNGVVLRGVRLYNLKKQDSPVILSMKDLYLLGVPRINERDKRVELMAKKEKN